MEAKNYECTLKLSRAIKMRVAILLLAIGFATAAPKNQQRIVGGSLTNISSYPSIVSCLYSWNFSVYRQTCGGTLLNTRSILTAAHCTLWDSARNWRVRVGSTYANSGGVVHAVESIINHPQYNQQVRYNNDVAILRTASTIEYVNNAVQPALVAGSNYNLADNEVVWAAGWGTTTYGVSSSASEQLRDVQVWSVDQDICRQRYATIGLVISDNMLCSGWLDVGGRDQCQGDSGGPLYHNGVVVGVCSFGRECGLPQYPGVNARVSRFTSWIQANA